MRIEGYEGLLVARFFDIPTVYYEELDEPHVGGDENETLHMPVILEILSAKRKKPVKLFQQEDEMRRWVREFIQTRERDERVIMKEQPSPLGRLRVNVGLRYDTGKSYISMSPYPDCKQLVSQGVKPATMEFGGLEECSQYRLYELVHASGIRGHILGQIGRILYRLMQMFYQGDFLRIQVTPLIITLDEEVLIGGLTLDMDDEALSRQEKIIHLLQRKESDRLVSEAQQAGLIYRSIDPSGTIGVMASGMGLALSSLDHIVSQGMSASGCLVLGGGLSEERMAAGIRIMTRIPDVQGIFVNIYGGVNSCEIMAKGIVNALEDEDPELAIVIKMGGHDQEEGWRILDESGLLSIRKPSSEDAIRQLQRLVARKEQNV